MSGVLADTHAIIWYLLKSDRLSQKALDALDSATRDGETIFISAITIVEIIYLVEKGKIPEAAFQSLLDKITADETALEIVPLDLPVSNEIPHVPRDTVPDMPDRIIAATAIYLNLPLVTRDASIRTLSISTVW